MEMTIKQLADELGVSKTTISKAVLVLGFNEKLHKVGNRYMLSEMQILQIKSKISQFSPNDEREKPQTSPTLQTDEEKKTQISPTLQTDEEKMQISLLKQQNAILQQQLSVLSKQLSVKDEQMKLLQEQLVAKDEQIGQITAAMESMATALSAEQAWKGGYDGRAGRASRLRLHRVRMLLLHLSGIYSSAGYHPPEQGCRNENNEEPSQEVIDY